jgi:hypothetical protein
LALAVLLLAGCGEPEGGASPPPEVVQAALNLAEAELVDAPARPRERLTPLAEAELPPKYREKPGCRLFRSGRLLVAAAGDSAVARVDGRLQTVPRAGLVDPSGAFFRGPGVTIGIGRLGAVAPAAEVPGVARLAGVTVGGMPKVDLQKFQAEWACYW